MLNDIINKYSLKSAGIAGIVGFFFSMIIVLISGGGFPALIIRPLISGVIMALLWVAVYQMLTRFVPEIIAAFGSSKEKGGGLSSESSDGMPTSSSARIQDDDFNFELGDNDNGLIEESVPTQELPKEFPSKEEPPRETGIKNENAPPKKNKVAVASDEMLVQGVPIKKDTELMARAIQHVLDTDKE